ncbi:MAG: hypothetical protein L3K15_08175 [Thermoplasmata archaeon]|nr:hypothetical protein [Thermoplasmata archaeon]
MKTKLSKGRIGIASALGVSLTVGLLLSLASASGPVHARVVNSPALTSPALIKLHAAIELTSGSPISSGLFGNSVAVAGNYVVVGAPYETHATHTGAGNVYVYNATTGQSVAVFGSPNPKFAGFFGFAVAISGATIVVGAPNESAKTTILNAGNAYVYSIVGSVVTLQHTLPEPVPQPGTVHLLGGAFGYSVGISGTSVVVGAPNETSQSTKSAGDAYVFTTAGTWIANLTTPNPTAQGLFGLSVALSGTTAFVGAPAERSGGHAYMILKATGPASGRTVYVLSSPNAQGSGFFGASLAVGNGMLVVGAYSENVSSSLSAGNAYVFDSTTGLFTRQLTNPAPEYYGQFGAGVAVGGGDIVVGSPGATANGELSAGNVTLFNATSGKVVYKLTSPNFVGLGGFGASVAADASCIVVGAPGENVGTLTLAGHAYIY